jgi:ubiquitin-conjugating enzyme E2 S
MYPIGYFLTKIFHPNVSKTGDICVNTLKKDWKPDLGMQHILTVVKCLLIYPNPESALNEEAGKLLLERLAAFCLGYVAKTALTRYRRYDDYAKHARMMTDIHAKPAKEGADEPEAVRIEHD